MLYNDISDHFPVFNALQLDSKTTKKYEYVFKRMNTSTHIEKLNTELKNTVTDTFITSNGVHCTDNTDIANYFNIYFTTVGNTLAANVPQTDNDPIELIE